MPSENTNVFVSYSHADALLVSPVVKLLRVNKSLVFQDIEDIQPGKRWQSEIAKALSESNLVVVFWCTHANRSKEVSQEWQAAIEQKKDLLPLLLDTTPLPQQLAEFQWIDFRGMVGASHSSMDLGDRVVEASAPRPLARAAPKSAPRLLLTAAAAVVTAALFLGVFFSLQFGARHEINRPAPTLAPASTPVIDLPPPQARVQSSPNLFFLGIVLAVAVCVIMLLLKRRQKRMKSIKSSKRPAGDIERHIASKVEAEILRRTSLSRGEGR
jgi:hypothetical protein